MIESIITIIIIGLISMAAGGSLPYSEYLNKKGEKNSHGVDKGGILPFNGTWVPEVILAIVVAQAAYNIWLAGLPYADLIALACAGVAYAGIQAGHGNALPPYNRDNHNEKRTQTISPVVNFITDLLGFERFSPNWSRTWHAVKGFIITLPIGGLGFIGWPLGYEISNQLHKHGIDTGNNHGITEFTAGALGIGVPIFFVEYICLLKILT